MTTPLPSLPRLLPIFALALACTSAAQAADGWIALFNGKTLDGWEQRSGTALYRVEDGAIVGKTVAKTGNTFLCTKETYGDFVLEFEFKVADGMNSGVPLVSDEVTITVSTEAQE